MTWKSKTKFTTRKGEQNKPLCCSYLFNHLSTFFQSNFMQTLIMKILLKLNYFCRSRSLLPKTWKITSLHPSLLSEFYKILIGEVIENIRQFTTSPFWLGSYSPFTTPLVWKSCNNCFSQVLFWTKRPDHLTWSRSHVNMVFPKFLSCDSHFSQFLIRPGSLVIMIFSKLLACS